MTFSVLPLPLRQALADRGYDAATPVQAAVLEPGLETRDLIVSAQTGSGKTVAYGLALASTLIGKSDVLPKPGAPLALVIAPTRELALQVERELAWLYAAARGHVTACVGGMDPRRERRALQEGTHIVVGTPGRLRDHLERGALDMSALKAVVLDEADEMLDLGFREDLEFILQASPPERRTFLFSATLPKGIVALASRYQNDAARIETKGGEAGHADIEYRAVRVLPNERIHAIVNLLRHVDSPGTIIFCNTRENVRHLHALLQERGFSAVFLSGELSQNERNHALQALRDHRARICVATDVAARGLDLPNLDLVIHADLPTDSAILQHRSGRTGRAGRKGISALLVTGNSERKAERLLAMANATARWGGAPSADEIRALDRERLLADPILTSEISEDERELARFLLDRCSAEHLAAALARAYRAHLPEPEEVTDPGPSRPKREARPLAPGRGGKGFDRAESVSGGVWFRLNIGRQKNADPNWLVPMLCKRGKVSKREIGTIRIFDRETKVEIAAEAAEHFALHAAMPGEDSIRIEHAAEPPRPKGPAGSGRGGPPPKKHRKAQGR